MSAEWEVLTLADLTINHDTKRKPVKAPDRKAGPYPYYGASGIVDFVDGYLFDGDYLLVAEDGENLRTRQTPIAFMASGKFWVNNHAHIVTGNERANTLFLMYSLLVSDVNRFLTGAVMPKLTQGNLNKIPIACPPRQIQEAIVQILGTIDGRIALLRETNATLEAIAQALFKSWFVDFDPVHAKQQGREPEGMDADTAALFPDGFEESAVGLVPKGWRITTLTEAFEINPTRVLKKGTVAPYLDMAKLSPSGHCVELPIQREMASGTKFRNGDSLMARITPCLENGKIAFVDFLVDGQIGWGSTEFLVLRPKAPLPEYFGYLLCRHSAFRDFAVQSMSGTSGRQRIQNDLLGRYLLTLPDGAVALAFKNVIEPIQKSISANHEQAQTLTTLRDTLLPRLISGQLRLPDAEEAVA